MKRMAVLLMCSGAWALQATSTEEKLVDAVRRSDAPAVTHLLQKVNRSPMKKELIPSLVTLAEKVLTDEKSRFFLRSSDGQIGKIVGGTLCSLIGLYLSVYGDGKGTYRGFSEIYTDWSEGLDQVVNNYYCAVGGSVVALTGLYLVYDGLRFRRQEIRVSDAREVRDSLVAQIEELGL